MCAGVSSSLRSNEWVYHCQIFHPANDCYSGNDEYGRVAELVNDGRTYSFSHPVISNLGFYKVLGVVPIKVLFIIIAVELCTY